MRILVRLGVVPLYVVSKRGIEPAARLARPRVGDRVTGNDITSYDLENGNLTAKASHLLAFEPGLVCQERVIPGYVTLLGTGKFLASSNGPVHFMEPPVRVDEQAILWLGRPALSSVSL